MDQNTAEKAGTAASSIEMAERTRRAKTLKTALILSEDERTSHDCVVRDMTGKGAKLQFKDPVLLPDHFWVYFGQEHFRIHCHVIWTHGLEMGVEFNGDRINTLTAHPHPEPPAI